MRHHLASSRLAARAGIRQVVAVQHADTAAVALDRQVGSLWQELLRIIASPAGFAEDYKRALAVLHRLQPVIYSGLWQRLGKLARWSYDAAAKATAQELPIEYLQAAVVRRRVGESRQLTEDVIPADLLDPLRSPETLSPEEARELFRSLLFQPPSEEAISRILAPVLPSADWLARGIGDKQKRQAEDLAQQLALGLSQGLTQREVAKTLLPYVDGSRVRARRAARTFGIYVAQKGQEHAHEAVDDLTVGRQIHAQLDQFTRPAHRHRNGTIFYYRPGPGQANMRECPHPPLEGDQRTIAWNCRCFLTVVLSPPEHLHDASARTVFVDNSHAVIPDPSVYSDWFRGADLRSRRLAVGSRRYAVVSDRLGTTPEFEHFIDPETGQPLTIAELKRETPVQRAERVAKVRALVAQRREAIRTVAMFGFEPPSGRRRAHAT